MPGFIRVGHQWSADEWWSAVRCRLGRFGAHSRVPPGLYALGSPDDGSPVLVTASYRLSFDMLRRDLDGIHCWILALDTRGLGVSAAAAAGLFSTDELVTRVTASRLSRVVRHRTLVVPARAFGAIDATLISTSTGFDVRFGPSSSCDVAPWLREGASPRKSRFGMRDTLALTPVEVGRSLARYPAFAFAAVIYAGLGPGGINLGRAFAGSWPLLVLGVVTVICGSLLAPVLHALLPRMALLMQGALFGFAATAGVLWGVRHLTVMDGYLAGACMLFFPAAAAVMADQFAQALPEPRPPRGSGMSRFLAVAAAAIGLSIAILLALSRLGPWRPGP
jgi:hypothetical protein